MVKSALWVLVTQAGGFKFKLKKNFSKQKIGAVFRADQAGVFSNPTQTGSLSQISFKNGTGIGVTAISHRLTYLFFDKCHQSQQSLRKKMMIISPPGIRSDLPLHPFSSRKRFWGERWIGIWDRQYQDGFTVRQDEARVGAAGA